MLLAPLWFGNRTDLATVPVPLPAQPFNNVPWDDDVADDDLTLDNNSSRQEPVAVFDDERFRLFQPGTRRDLLSEHVYWSSYGPFLGRMAEAFPVNLEDPS
jgi:hypothetical protein